MERATFRERLRAAAARARDFGRTFVEERLPDPVVFRVMLNASFDGNPLRDDQRVYPSDGSYERARELRVCEEETVVAALWREGAVPEWVDLMVIGETGSATLVDVTACGRFTTAEERLYHAREGYPPFHVLGPVLPPGHVEGRQFSIYHRASCWDGGDVERLARNGDKVWSLELLGEELDDEAIAALPELPGLEILEARWSPSRGEALSTLRRYPRLRVLRMTLAGGERFSARGLAEMPSLVDLNIAGLPGRDWGFASLAEHLPALKGLTLKSASELVLRGNYPHAVSSVHLTGRRLTGGALLPSRLDRAEIHLSEASAAEIEGLFATVDAVSSLDLSDTPIDEATATRLATRLRPHLLALSNTRIDDGALRRIGDALPRTRIFPSPASQDGSQQ